MSRLNAIRRAASVGLTMVLLGAPACALAPESVAAAIATDRAPWVAAAIVAAVLLLIFGAYRLRVRQITRAQDARFDERLAARMRVARELHDTFLQTVQGSKMVADHALKDAADHQRMVHAMTRLSTWLERATEEGQAALDSLKTAKTMRNDLVEAFDRAIDECRGDSQAQISLAVRGEAKDLHPVVRDEIYRIGYEAIRNACVHSGADRIEISLDYGDDLIVRVLDDGVGIHPAVIEDGKDGHGGLRRMKERAQRIDSHFSINSTAGSGTDVTLVVPGGVSCRGLPPIEKYR